MNVYAIDPPDAEGSRRIARCIYDELRGEHAWGRVFPAELSAESLDRLARLNPAKCGACCWRHSALRSWPGAMKCGRMTLPKSAPRKNRGLGFIAARERDRYAVAHSPSTSNLQRAAQPPVVTTFSTLRLLGCYLLIDRAPERMADFGVG